MGVKFWLLTICKFREGVLQNGSLKHLKNKWAKYFSIDFHSTYIRVTPDTSINFSQLGS